MPSTQPPATATLYPYETLGHADYGWLDARYHFSFAHYSNPNRTGFGSLLVINDDTVRAGRGFDMHPHQNMEIITYVRQGAITHRDSLGNIGRTAAGNVQVMSAGTGVRHSEYNLETEDTRLYQIWIQPNILGVSPRWDMKAFPDTPAASTLPLLVSGQQAHADTEALFIYQDAAVYGGKLTAGTMLTQTVAHQAYILASQGAVRVNDITLHMGDGAEIVGTHSLAIHALTDAEILIIDAPGIAS